MGQIFLKNLDGKNLVTQSNNLVEARYTLSKNEQLILCAMISFINPEDKEFLTYKTSISQFSELLGIDKKSSMREIGVIVTRLLSRVITIETPNGWEKFQWVSYAKADKKEDFLLLRFHDRLKPYLLALKKRFTSFRLDEVVDLKSVYSIRIYQLLRDYHGINKSDFIYDLSEFRAIVLGENSKKYINSFKNFRVNVLEKSKKELDEKGNLSFTFENIRIGRKIGRIKFSITKKIKINKSQPTLIPKSRTDQDNPQSQEIKEIQEMISLGIPIKQANKLLEQYGAEYITEKLKITEEEDPNNSAGFLISALKNNWKNQTQQKQEKQKAKQDKARQKVLEEKRVENIMTTRLDLENTFSAKALNKYLNTLSDDEKAELFSEVKQENPYVKSLESNIARSFITLRIPEYKKNKEKFINSELKKMELF
jgi:plasmid replication initiation protein